jgi:putative transcriptional regulator
MLLCWAIVGVAAAADEVRPQNEEPNGALLVARPGLVDPNFRQTVVLVTQRPDGSTVGVILNRPTTLEVAPLLPDLPADKYRDALYFGGPVLRQTVVAVFESKTPPEASAFHVLQKVYMGMREELLRKLLDDEGARYRLYVGFSGWSPGQLESEFEREGWYLLPADPGIVFRADTRDLWEELVTRATSPRAALSRGQARQVSVRK